MAEGMYPQEPLKVMQASHARPGPAAVTCSSGVPKSSSSSERLLMMMCGWSARTMAFIWTDSQRTGVRSGQATSYHMMSIGP